MQLWELIKQSPKGCCLHIWCCSLTDILGTGSWKGKGDARWGECAGTPQNAWPFPLSLLLVLWLFWGSWALRHRLHIDAHPAWESEVLKAEPSQAPPLLTMSPKWSSRLERTRVSYKLAAVPLCPPDLPRTALVAHPNWEHTRKWLWGLQFIQATLMGCVTRPPCCPKTKEFLWMNFHARREFSQGSAKECYLHCYGTLFMGITDKNLSLPLLSVSCIIHESLCTDMERSLRPLVKWKQLVIKQYA